MNKINLNSVNTLVRVDKNLYFNYNYFKKYTTDDSRLIFLLLVYFAKERQYDLFGFGKLDPVKFCDELGLTKNHIIWTKHDNPRQFKDILTEEERKINETLDKAEEQKRINELARKKLKNAGITTFDTVLENSLYCLLKDVYEFSDNGNTFLTKSGSYVKSKKLSAIQFIKSLSVVEENKGKYIGAKKYYHYQLSQDFTNNLANLFFHINTKNLSLSFKKSYEGLYLRLCNIADELPMTDLDFCELEFEEVKELLEINSDRADYVKQKIIKAFDFLLNQDDLKERIKMEWFQKVNQNHKYGIKIGVINSTNKEKAKAIKKEIWEDIKIQELRISLFEAFKRRYPEEHYLPIEEQKENYKKWLKNAAIDLESKQSAYLDIFKKYNPQVIRTHEKEFLIRWTEGLASDYAKYI